jgi:hypothetical protein
MDVKTFTKTRRGAFAVGFVVSALAVCAPNADGMGAADFGTVTGRVVDMPSLQPISGATIAVGNIVSVTADSDHGGFIVRNVPPGKRTLTISAIGWKTYRTQITVLKNQAVDAGTIGLPSSLLR